MTQQAIKTVEPDSAVVVNDAPIPTLDDDFFLAETKAVAINPTDWKHMKGLTVSGSTLGCDWSGVVLEVGKNVTKFKPGDEVFGVCHGASNIHLDSGAYAQKIVCNEAAAYHKPSSLSFAEASTFGVGLITTGQVMYFMHGMSLPSPENLNKKPTKDVLIYGGSSSTGTLAIQLAKLSGYRVLTTASPSNFELLKSRGADLIYDYNNPASIDAIKSATNGDLTFIVDCIGTESTATFCAPLLSTQHESHYHSIQFPLKPKLKELRPEPSVKATQALGYTMFGEPVSFKNGAVSFEARPEEAAFTKNVWHPAISVLFEKNLLRPHPADVRKGGLTDVLDGIHEMMEKGAPRGKKIVYSLE